MNFLSIGISFIAGISAYYFAPFFPILTLVIYIPTLLLLCKFKKGTLVLCIVLIILGFCYSHVRSKPYSNIESLLGKRVSLTFSCFGCSKGHLIIREEDILNITETNSNNLLKIRGIRAFVNSEVLEGHLYKASGLIARDAFFLNPGANQQFVPLYIDQIRDIGPAQKGYDVYLRERLQEKIDDALSSDSAAFIKAIVIGYRADMPPAIRDAFSRSGLAHILSISGAHFGLLLFIVFRSFKLLFYLLPERLLIRITLYTTPTKVSALLTAPIIIFYLLLSSMNYPAIRAFIMILLLLLGLLIERKRYLPHALLLAAIIIVLIEPTSVADLSFQLSFLSTLSIALFLSFIPKGKEDTSIKLPTLAQKCLYIIKESLLITFAATLGTALLVAYHFHYFSIISPLSNLFITPFIGFGILPISLVSSMIFLLTGWFPFAGFIDTLTRAMLWTVSSLSNAPWASAAVPNYPMVILVLGVFSVLLSSFLAFRNSDLLEGSNRSPLLKITVIMIFPYIIAACYYLCPDKALSVTFLDVGQGDAAVIELPDKRTIVVDTGKNGYVLSQYLKYRGISKIDVIAISHPQRDHAGGLYRLLLDFTVYEIWDNGKVIYPQAIDEGIKIRHLSRGDVITGNGYKILALHPHEDYLPENNIDNNYSLVLQVAGRGSAFLFTGDIERDGIYDLMHLGSTLKSRVLKLPHHGSYSSMVEEFIPLISPEFVIISSGRLNRYGFPHQSILNALQGVRVLRTDIDGAIKFTLKNSGELTLKTARDYMLKRVAYRAEEWENIKGLFYAW